VVERLAPGAAKANLKVFIEAARALTDELR
jgi:hypothetical protein